jgi:hypothetical protein
MLGVIGPGHGASKNTDVESSSSEYNSHLQTMSEVPMMSYAPRRLKNVADDPRSAMIVDQAISHLHYLLHHGHTMEPWTSSSSYVPVLYALTDIWVIPEAGLLAARPQCALTWLVVLARSEPDWLTRVES